jgi:seryl-tRNA synthetase
MFDIKWIRANEQAFDAALSRRRGSYPKAAELIALDEKRRGIILTLNELQEKRNRLSKLIGQAKAQKNETQAAELMADVARLKEAIPAAEAEERQAQAALDKELAALPNMLADDVPDGADETANVEYFGRNQTAEQAAAVRVPKPSFAFKPKEHFELGEAMGFMDFEIAAKISGSRFVVLKSQLARLERALGQFMLDTHTGENGYVEVQPPILVRDEALYGTGQLPKFEMDLFSTEKSRRLEDFDPGMQGELKARLAHAGVPTSGTSIQGAAATPMPPIPAEFKLDPDDLYERARKSLKLYLIPTAEVPLTNLVRESIRAEDELPLRFTALTP